MKKDNVKYFTVNIMNKFYNVNKSYFDTIKHIIIQERKSLVLNHEDTYEVTSSGQEIFPIKSDEIILNQLVKLRPKNLCFDKANAYSEENSLLEYLELTQSKLGIVYVFDDKYCLVKSYRESKYHIIQIVNLIKDTSDKRVICKSNYNILNEIQVNNDFISMRKRTDDSATLKNYLLDINTFRLGFLNEKTDEVGMELPLHNEKEHSIVMPIQMVINMLRLGVSVNYSYKLKHVNVMPTLGFTRYEWNLHQNSSSIEKEYNTAW